MSDSVTNIVFSPLLPMPLLIGLLTVAGAAVAFSLWRRARGMWPRIVVLVLLALTLFNPEAVRESRRPLHDVAIVVVDESRSQGIGNRQEQTGAALEAVEARLREIPGLEVRVVRSGGGAVATSANDDREQGTRLATAAQQAMAEVPRDRLAGVVAITDGQVHDADEAAEEAADSGESPRGPVHVLLTGERDELDRRLSVVRAPSFGIVGKAVPVTIRVDDLHGGAGGNVTVTMRREDAEPTEMSVAIGEEHTLEVPVTHAGALHIEMSAAPIPGELTEQNNRTVVTLSGVRDRLRVLLVSGQPHQGERTWRRMLKADPSVDLVHFTILRPPEKDDLTPLNELALITFPIRELFQVKLPEFDLIIFDRYRFRGVLPSLYLQNIADYVHKGGAVLVSVGADFATPFSLARTPLSQVLPAEPTGRVLELPFRPSISRTGQRHPVTAGLPRVNEEGRPWGHWFRQVEAGNISGDTLLDGAGQQPLLVLNRLGEGRVALMLSDHIWLWSRHYEGGGPHAELLRRLSHWLMKEPDLEEETLTANVVGDRMTITRRSLEEFESPVTVTAPSGETVEVQTEPAGPGMEHGVLEVEEQGLYRLSDGRARGFAAVGAADPVEYSDLRATPDKLSPLAAATGGGVMWLADGLPELRRVAPGRDTAGRDWLGLRMNQDYVVTGVDSTPLLPALLVLLLGLGGLMLAWRRESR
ncbi:MAG: hypothetical protein WD270_10845 [Acetobacterales bacterium]